jgi:hypothetical protein
MQYILLVILIILFLYILYIDYTSYREPFSQDNVEIVISRYNEKLDWLANAPFSENKYIVYNKGPNTEFYKSDKLKEIVDVENVGRESHTYLYHIIKNYGNLAGITVFLPGSADLPNKFERSKEIVEYVNNNDTSVLSCSKDYVGNVHDLFKDFEMNEYLSTNNENKTMNADSSVYKSELRPFGTWYKTIFGENAASNCFVVNGIFAISKEDIEKKPLSYYEDLIKHVDNHKNPEAGHYFERSWENVFGPFDNVKYL